MAQNVFSNGNLVATVAYSCAYWGNGGSQNPVEFCPSIVVDANTSTPGFLESYPNYPMEVKITASVTSPDGSQMSSQGAFDDSWNYATNPIEGTNQSPIIQNLISFLGSLGGDISSVPASFANLCLGGTSITGVTTGYEPGSDGYENGVSISQDPSVPFSDFKIQFR